MNPPLFSIVIPTKNRAFIVGDAIQSVLDQTFSDFEIVIADNDDSDETKKVVDAYRDPRINYVRTGGLTMPDNWEMAYRRAGGQRLLLLEDKSVLKPWCLARLDEVWREHNPDLVSWRQDVFHDDAAEIFVETMDGSGKMTCMEPVSAINAFLSRPRWEVDQFLPRGLNSALSRSLYSAIVSGPEGRLCPPMSPDYTMAFLQLAVAERFWSIDESLTVYGSVRHSQGYKTLLNQNTDVQIRREFGGAMQSFLDLVPLKAGLATACLWNDFLVLRKKVRGRLEAVELDWAHFFSECWSDLEFAKRCNVINDEGRRLWEQALAEQPDEVQQRVRARLAPPPREPAWKRIGRTIGLHHVKRCFQSPPPQRRKLSQFKTALEYVRWEGSNRRVNVERAVA